MTDPLAQFRRRGAGAAASPEPPKQGDGYVAFEAKDKVARLRIRRANDPTRAPAYPFLLDISYDGDYGTNFVLTYTFMMVLVEGQNLQPVIAAIETGMADYIQEFDPTRWQKPKESSVPVIESIRVILKTGTEKEESGKTLH